MKKNLIQIVILSLPMLLINGCFDRSRSTAQICETNPKLCHKLNLNDGQCNVERAKLIRQRLTTVEKPTDLNKFDELLVTKKYAKCMELATQIEVVTLKEKKSLRTEALHHAYNSITRIEQELKASYQPSIIYYRWTQGDKEAQEQFLKLEHTEYLNNPQLQLALATYYANKDKNKTIMALEKGLSFYNGDEESEERQIVTEIIKTLATVNHSVANLKLAYLWVLVGEEFGIPVVGKDKLKRLYPLTDLQINKIESTSTIVIEQIKKGNFTSSLLSSLKREENNEET